MVRYMAGIQNPEIAAYIVRWLEERRAAKTGAKPPSWDSIVKSMKEDAGDAVSKQQLIGMCAKPPRIGAGGKTVDVFAKLLFDGSIDALRRAAQEHWDADIKCRVRFESSQDIHIRAGRWST